MLVDDPLNLEPDGPEEDYMRAMRLVEDMLFEVLAHRVLLHGAPVAKNSQLPLVLNEFYSDDYIRFRRNMRCSPTTFDALVTCVADDPVFHNESHHPQMSVREQFAIAMYRFGHDGNAASVEDIAQWAGVSVGMVLNATRRVMVALLGLHDSAIHWPDDEEKEEAKEWVEETVCAEWRDGHSMVDGTLVPLFEKPGFYGEAYYSRKACYALNVQIINLPKGLIIDYVVGHVGSVHDSSAFEGSRVYREHDTLLGQSEWIWADSAYPSRRWCVAPYKKPAANIAENKTFNRWVSRVRVRSEHTMGMLKGRFGSLRRLRQQINNKRAHELAVMWVRCCLILHNLIMRIENFDEDEDFVRELVAAGEAHERALHNAGNANDDNAPLENEAQQLAEGQAWREHVKDMLFDSGFLGDYN